MDWSAGLTVDARPPEIREANPSRQVVASSLGIQKSDNQVGPLMAHGVRSPPPATSGGIASDNNRGFYSSVAIQTSMPKAKRPKQEDADRTPARSWRVARIVAHWVVAVALLGACATGLYYARQYVEQTAARPTDPPTVVFTNRPAWMSDRVARQLAASFRPPHAKSVFDHNLLVTTSRTLKASPWIAQLRQVRRAYGNAPGDTLEIDCDFRAPMALARFEADYWFVDAHGVKLPERFAANDLPFIVYGADGSTNIRVIEGIHHAPPKEAGQTWVGDDLAAGLELVCRLYDQPCAQEIVKVDVSNFHGRVDAREAHIVLVTKYNTEVRWGRPWTATDSFIEVAPERKLVQMQRVLAQYGRVDAGLASIDLRFDGNPKTQNSAEANTSR